MSTATLTRHTRSETAADHGRFRHVTRPATQEEFLSSAGMSRRRYEEIIRKYQRLIEQVAGESKPRK